MKKSLLALVVSSFSLHATAQSLSPDAQAAHKAALQCLHKYSLQLDDGVSSVEAIAKIVANSCINESSRFVEIWTVGANVDRRAILEKMLVTNVDSASFYILSNRAGKK